MFNNDPIDFVTPHEPVIPPSVNDRADIPSIFTPRIDFLHPSYPSEESYLLRLPAFDHHQGGLQHAVALDLLTIIAGNAVGGYLARTRDGPAIDLPRYGLLREPEYYFVVPYPARDDSVDVNEPYKYPVCPSFTNWRFPHDSFPTHWSSPTISRVTLANRPPSAFSEKILASNGTCIVTGYTTSVQACHLCPHSQADWFRKNKMETYNLAEYNRAEHFLDDTANGITLRADLHLYFDAGGFVLMRKSDSGYTLHCLQSSGDILPMFHNHKTQPLTNVRPELLYTRLAYAILPKVSAFLSSPGLPKRIIRVKAGSAFETEIVDISAKEFAKQSQSQNRSRKERSRADSPPADELSLDLPTYKKTKLSLTFTSTCGSQPSTRSVFGTSPTAPLSQNEFQDLKNSWIEMQRPLDYAPPQKTESHQGDLKCGLGNTQEEDSKEKCAFLHGTAQATPRQVLDLSVSRFHP